ncbi:MAG: hypothetical protein KME14_20485 [Tildeniella torsiva UHER 1998/13D]|jgi:hypothetical protein|nr:hypothetical protein [Tildeniella torsiva UHER 1998/13D]
MKVKSLKLIALAMLIAALAATAAYGGKRDQFPGNLCPGSGCPTRGR